MTLKNLLTPTLTLTLTLNILTNQIEGNGVILKGKRKQEFFIGQYIESKSKASTKYRKNSVLA